MAKRVKMQVMDTEGLALMKNRVETLLSERGVHVDHKLLCEELAQAGCIVDDGQVKFPPEIIAKAVASVPREFTLYSSSGEHDLQFPRPDGGFYVRTNTGAPLYRTAKGDKHVVRLENVEERFKLVTSMENVDYVALPSTSESEVAAEAVDG